MLISVDLDQRTGRGEAQLTLSLRGYAGHFYHQISDLSILDDALLQPFKDKPHHTLYVRLLKKLIRGEIELHHKRNLTKTKSFRNLINQTPAS